MELTYNPIVTGLGELWQPDQVRFLMNRVSTPEGRKNLTDEERFIISNASYAPPDFNKGQIAGNQPSASMGTTPPSGVGFQDVIKNLQGGPGSTNLPKLDLGLTEKGILPQTQKALDILEEISARARRTGQSTAEALAGRRGLAGSSIEQFGVAEAGRASGEIARKAEVELLLQDMAIQNRFKEIEFQAGVETSNLFSQLDLQSRIAAANLTSDELASIRNLIESGKDRDLQLYLGERGIAVQQNNIDAARQIAKENQPGFFEQLVSNIGIGFNF